MTRWDLKSILMIPLGATAYTPGQLRYRAKLVRAKNPEFARILDEVSKKVESGAMTPMQAYAFVHKVREGKI